MIVSDEARVKRSRGFRCEWAVLAGFVVLTTAGCDGGPKLPRVTGSVTIAGQGVPGGTVVFHPTGGSGTMAYGQISTEGKYQMRTGSSEGVIAGDYIVTVMTGATAGPVTAGNPVGGPPVKSDYADVTKSPLKVTVPDEGKTYDIEIK